ncbi:MAG: putative bifunctional diguanylate cyclase/phosphodiesterase [Acidimicrobiia bacterium]
MTLASIGALTLGITANSPIPRRPWTLMTAAAIAWAVASVLRSGMDSTDSVPLADAISVAAYALMFAGVGQLLRTQSLRRDGTGLDALLVATGAGLVGWVVLTVPSLPLARTPYQRVGDVCFPVLDAVLLYLGMRLAIASPRRCASSTFFLIGVTAILVADVLWAFTATEVFTTPVPVQIACYLVAFALLGAMALHPSMRDVANSGATEAPSHARGRLVAMGLVLLLPTAAAVWQPPTSALEWAMLIGFTVVMCALVFARMAHAIATNARYEARLVHQARHDPLTGLGNRELLLQSVSEDLGSGAEVGLIVLDLDHFKYVNDTYGHAFGDSVLIAVAERLHAALAPNLVARIGGDEFAIAFNTLQTSVEDIAALTMAAVRSPITIDAAEIALSASIGMTSGLRARVTAIDLLREADTAVHRAKDNGRNGCAWFDLTMHASATRRLEIASALRYALERHELEVHYQPIVNLRDGSWRGVEALLRWNRPNLGMVPPAVFIPVAEETGLIVDIGSWVLETAARQVAQWRADLGVQWALSVNVSPRQMGDPALPVRIEQVLDETGLPPSALWVELTESMLVENNERSKQLLESVHATGAKIVLDDFGTGYSSLSYLHQFPIDRVKVDRSFVMALGDSHDSGAIVRAVLGMAGALGLDVVAEGIETLEQHRRLLEMGCEAGQGFLFSRPMGASVIETSHRVTLADQSRIIPGRLTLRTPR